MQSNFTQRANQIAERKRLHMLRLDNDALMSVMDTKEGRWSMMRLFDKCNLFQSTFTGNSQTFFNEGVRWVGLQYLNALKSTKHGLELYHTAEKEYAAEFDKYNQLIDKEDE